MCARRRSQNGVFMVPPSTAARVMDRFERVKKIGEGSFGKALLVKQKDLEKLLVVKEIDISIDRSMISQRLIACCYE